MLAAVGAQAEASTGTGAKVTLLSARRPVPGPSHRVSFALLPQLSEKQQKRASRLTLALCGSPPRGAFSILYRIEWVETWRWVLWHILRRSFSILYRIEWVETA